jgi:ABC-type glycerol-3-phosphate transport system substrate-binding protein
VKIRILFALAIAAVLAACGGGSTPSPAGWQPVPGASPNTAWSTGSGGAQQTYLFEQRPFAGTLQELASQQATQFASGNAHAHFDGSDTFAPCPGQAALEYFSAGPQRVYLQGLATRNGNATIVTYARPTNTQVPTEVTAALKSALCG